MPEIPLRLRRRRDGSLALTDSVGVVLTPDSILRDSVLPQEHLFIYSWLNGEGARVARVEYAKDGDRTIRLNLANATAVYEVVEDKDEQVEVMVRQADHRGSMAALEPEQRSGAAAALAAQGILARLADFKITKPAKINEERAEELALARAEREAK